ncbi:MAG TPA: hypothetical protein VFV71_12950, partial [Burkholderiales bacterium]|nr:hypothetical protein [Burkholderiales bacterium]
MSAGRRGRLLAVWALLAVLVGVIVTLQLKSRSQLPGKEAENIHGVEGSRMLLPVPIEQVAVVEVVIVGTQHRFERDATGTWFYHGIHSAAQAGHAHQADPRQTAIIDKALTALGRTRM